MGKWNRWDDDDDWGYWDRYQPRPKRQAKGGIKAQSKRGAFGESWWAKRWIAVLESFDIGARLQRGQAAAFRSGAGQQPIRLLASIAGRARGSRGAGLVATTLRSPAASLPCGAG